jgi:thioredoxin 1
MTTPILEKLANEYEAKVGFLPINADISHDILEHFKIIGIPTVLTVRSSRVVGRVTGAQNEAGYRTMFEAIAEAREVIVPMSGFDRNLRLGAGSLLVIVGISTGNWLVGSVGVIIAFLGVYDRCPIWKAITSKIQPTIKLTELNPPNSLCKNDPT